MYKLTAAFIEENKLVKSTVCKQTFSELIPSIDYIKALNFQYIHIDYNERGCKNV
jgi:hypothetical protein